MPKQRREQLDVDSPETGVDALLRAHRAMADAWYLNWQAEQQARLDRLLISRSSSDEEPRPN